jgi:flagellar protein FlaF
MSYPNARNAYNSVPPPGNPRQTEAWALTEAARRINDAGERFGPGPEFLAALRLNWRLWTIFQASLSAADSGVPDEIRGNMLSLANFVDRTTVDLIANPTVEGAVVLININRQIAAGLFSTPTGDTAPATDVPSPPSGGLTA